MGCLSSANRRILSEAGGVLPSLLERFLTSPDHRNGFEKSIRGTEGELALQIYKPLIFYEVAAFNDPLHCSAIGDLFKVLYVLPNKDALVDGFVGDQFQAFLASTKITMEHFNSLRKGLDTEITLKYLLPYQKENNVELNDGMVNAEDSNALLNVEEKNAEMLQINLDSPKSTTPVARKGKKAPSINFKKMFFGKAGVVSRSSFGGGNRVSWVGARSMEADLAVSSIGMSTDQFKILAPPLPIRRGKVKKTSSNK